MRIGVVLSQDRTMGGGFQYEKFALGLLKSVAHHLPNHEFVLLVESNRVATQLAHFGALTLDGFGIKGLRSELVEYGFPPIDPFLIPPRERTKPTLGLYPIDTDLNESLTRRGIERLLCLQPGYVGPTSGLPFAAPIWDLMHKHGFSFPEVTANFIPDYRDLLYINMCSKARVIFAESDAGRADVLRFYGKLIQGERVHIVDMLPSSFGGSNRSDSPSETPTKRVLELVGYRYFLYPAQFWEHKNHVVLLRAVHLLVESGVSNFKCVFTGTYSDFYTAANFKRLQSEVKELGLDQHILFLGFVSDLDLEFLYRNAQALLFPSYFGPSNLPPLEAISSNCPVVAADVYGIRDFLADRVVVVKPDDTNGWADEMRKLLDPLYRAESILKSRELLHLKDWNRSCLQLTRVVEALITPDRG